MTASLTHITFDCADAARLAGFWSAVLDQPVEDGASTDFATLAGTPGWMFVRVPEPKAGKNRVHPDITTSGLDAELARLETLGAVRSSEHREGGTTWVTMFDPEGNEFDLVAS